MIQPYHSDIIPIKVIFNYIWKFARNFSCSFFHYLSCRVRFFWNIFTLFQYYCVYAHWIVGAISSETKHAHQPYFHHYHDPSSVVLIIIFFSVIWSLLIEIIKLLSSLIHECIRVRHFTELSIQLCMCVCVSLVTVTMMVMMMELLSYTCHNIFFLPNVACSDIFVATIRIS